MFLRNKLRRPLGFDTLESRELLSASPLPVLLVIADRQDFYFKEYNDTRTSLLARGVPVVVAATSTQVSIPHAGSGQVEAGVSGAVVPDIALANVDSANYSAIAFVGGWGASMYQYAYNDPNGDGVTDNYYSHGFYNGDVNLNDGVVAPQKIKVNQLINEFLAADKPVAAVCHGVTVLAWARVDGVSPLAGKQVSVPLTVGTPSQFYDGAQRMSPYNNGQYDQVVANGGLANPVSGAIGPSPTAVDDVVVDGNVITAENMNSALAFGHAIATEVLANLPPAPTVTSVAPFVGPTSGGNAVVIVGTDFTGATLVRFNGADAASFTVVSSTQIAAIAPAGSATVNVTVTTAGGTSDTTSTADDYTYADPAVVSVVVNGGAVVARNSFGQAPSLTNQNSVVAQMEVTFNQRVHLDADAFTVTSLAAAATALGAAPSSVGASVTATGVPGAGDDAVGFTQFVLTFNPGPAVNSFTNAGVSFTTLKDGYFQLDLDGSKVHSGVSDTAAGRSDKFWSLFGAANANDVHVNGQLGDASVDTLLVDGIALNDVYAAFGASAQTPAYRAAFDWNLDGNVDGVDLTKLYQNFGTTWKM